MAMFATVEEMDERVAYISNESTQWLAKPLANIVAEYETDRRMYDYFTNTYVHHCHGYTYEGPSSWMIHTAYIAPITRFECRLYISAQRENTLLMADVVMIHKTLWDFVCNAPISRECNPMIVNVSLTQADINTARKLIIDGITKSFENRKWCPSKRVAD